MQQVSPSWLKSKGYLHITPKLDVTKNRDLIVSQITDPNYVANYAFFPLIHSVIKQRRYKKIPGSNRRAHSFRENGEIKKTVKERPLHYSNNMDALVFGYYAEILQSKYENILSENKDFNDCVIAYRKIPTGKDKKNKSTIHFAKEAFDEIRSRSQNNHCAVLLFDIKSFFSSMDHQILKNAWKRLMEFDVLPPDHKNVFKAATKFSYILKDDLRIKNKNKGRRKGYDEKRLAEIRNKTGKFCFYESIEEFRKTIKNKELKVYKYPFRNKAKEPIGIPQGLAISAILANMYLYEFDKKVFELVVNRLGGFYRRYSDDILVVCNIDDITEVKNFLYKEIENSKVDISKEKTEEYIFRKIKSGKKDERITSIKVTSTSCQIGTPLTYLGFEFYGYQTLIKSANLAKFYRRMIQAVKSKSKRAKELNNKSPDHKLAVFRRQLYKLYTIQDLNVTKVRTSINKLVKNDKGYYDLKSIKIEKPLKSNYLSYVKRASEIMEEPAIYRQIRNHERIFNEAISKHLNNNI